MQYQKLFTELSKRQIGLEASKKTKVINFCSAMLRSQKHEDLKNWVLYRLVQTFIFALLTIIFFVLNEHWLSITVVSICFVYQFIHLLIKYVQYWKSKKNENSI